MKWRLWFSSTSSVFAAFNNSCSFKTFFFTNLFTKTCQKGYSLGFSSHFYSMCPVRVKRPRAHFFIILSHTFSCLFMNVWPGLQLRYARFPALIELKGSYVALSRKAYLPPLGSFLTDAIAISMTNVRTRSMVAAIQNFSA